MQDNFALLVFTRAVSPIAYPLPRDWHLDLVLAIMDDLKGLDAVGFGLHVLLDDISPTPTTNICPDATVCYTEEIRLALHKPDWKAMHRKDVQGLECHGVVAAEH